MDVEVRNNKNNTTSNTTTSNTSTSLTSSKTLNDSKTELSSSPLKPLTPTSNSVVSSSSSSAASSSSSTSQNIKPANLTHHQNASPGSSSTQLTSNLLHSPKNTSNSNDLLVPISTSTHDSTERQSTTDSESSLLIEKEVIITHPSTPKQQQQQQQVSPHNLTPLTLTQANNYNNSTDMMLLTTSPHTLRNNNGLSNSPSPVQYTPDSLTFSSPSTPMGPSSSGGSYNLFSVNPQGKKSPGSVEAKSPTPSNKTKPYTCQQCNQTFSRQHNLKSHALTHSQDKPFQCTTCQHLFRRQHDLKRHTKLHTGEKPYSCPHCNRKFARLDALNRHLRAESFCGGPQKKLYQNSPTGQSPQSSSDLKPKVELQPLPPSPQGPQSGFASSPSHVPQISNQTPTMSPVIQQNPPSLPSPAPLGSKSLSQKQQISNGVLTVPQSESTHKQLPSAPATPLTSNESHLHQSETLKQRPHYQAQSQDQYKQWSSLQSLSPQPSHQPPPQIQMPITPSLITLNNGSTPPLPPPPPHPPHPHPHPPSQVNSQHTQQSVAVNSQSQNNMVKPVLPNLIIPNNSSLPITSSQLGFSAVDNPSSSGSTPSATQNQSSHYHHLRYTPGSAVPMEYTNVSPHIPSSSTEQDQRKTSHSIPLKTEVEFRVERVPVKTELVELRERIPVKSELELRERNAFLENRVLELENELAQERRELAQRITELEIESMILDRNNPSSPPTISNEKKRKATSIEHGNPQKHHKDDENSDDNQNQLKLELYQSSNSPFGNGGKLISTIAGSVPSINRNVSWMVVSSPETANNYFVRIQKLRKDPFDLFLDKFDGPNFRIIANNNTAVKTTTTSQTVETTTTNPPTTSTVVVVATANCNMIREKCSQDGRKFITNSNKCSCENLVSGTGVQGSKPSSLNGMMGFAILFLAVFLARLI
ncbi:hypothetical protein G9A89_022917 [Geosiphon pyriformis]|nr:hypothetical protein G9A89_022917 [Geosiphon pyriformis]